MHHHLQFCVQGFQVLLLRAEHFVISLLARGDAIPDLVSRGHHFLKIDPQWHFQGLRKGTVEVSVASVFPLELPTSPYVTTLPELSLKQDSDPVTSLLKSLPRFHD